MSDSAHTHTHAHACAHKCVHMHTFFLCNRGAEEMDEHQSCHSAHSTTHLHTGWRRQIAIRTMEEACRALCMCRSCCWFAWPEAEKMTEEGVCSCFLGSAQQKLSILMFTSCYKLPRPKQRRKMVSRVCSQPRSPVTAE